VNFTIAPPSTGGPPLVGAIAAHASLPMMQMIGLMAAAVALGGALVFGTYRVVGRKLGRATAAPKWSDIYGGALVLVLVAAALVTGIIGAAWAVIRRRQR
jgi:hypothetical protein